MSTATNVNALTALTVMEPLLGLERNIVMISITILDAAMMVETTVTLLLKPHYSNHNYKLINARSNIFISPSRGQEDYGGFSLQIGFSALSLPSPLENDGVF